MKFIEMADENFVLPQLIGTFEGDLIAHWGSEPKRQIEFIRGAILSNIWEETVRSIKQGVIVGNRQPNKHSKNFLDDCPRLGFKGIRIGQQAVRREETGKHLNQFDHVRVLHMTLEHALELTHLQHVPEEDMGRETVTGR